MQQTSTVLQAILDARERDLIDCVEFYAFDYVPGINGFDPADAEQCFSSVEGLTFTGQAYVRRLVERGSVSKFMGRKENSCSCRFSNAEPGRYMATWANSTQIEGKWMVCRVISLQSSTVLADSIVVFAGRCEKPGDFDNREVSITAKSSLGTINQTFPPRTFSPNDPENRSPDDPLFEGFRFTAVHGSLNITTRTVSPGIGSIFNKGRHVTTTLQYSSHATGADVAVPEIFGRCQVLLVPMSWLDIGGAVNMLQAASEGEIEGYANLRPVNPNYVLMSADYVFGKLGGVDEQVPDDNPNARWPGDGYYSRTAFVRVWVNGSDVNVDEREAPEMSAIILGRIIPVPDSAGDYTLVEWTDNPVHITRFLINDSRHLNEGAPDDDVNVETANFCDEPILDTTLGDIAAVTNTDLPQIGDTVHRYRPTGLIDRRRLLGEDPGNIEVDTGDGTLVGYGETDTSIAAPNTTFLRKRYTCNFPINERTSALDLIYGVVLPSFRGYIRRNGKGQPQILSERPADNTRLREATIVGATALKVWDVTPWKSSLAGKLLIGNGLTASEVRTVLSATYTADGNSITIAKVVTGGVTATLSGATFSGGSPTVQASATVTIGGTMSGTVTLTINGFSIVYSLTSSDTTTTVAAMLGHIVNATPQLRQFVRAEWAGSVLTIRAKWGVLNVAALAQAHAGPAANPTTPPVLSASAGLLAAGSYLVSYADRTATGSTAKGPTASITLTALQKIDVGAIALPAGVISRDWYVSKYPNSTEMVYYSNQNGSAFSITALPASRNQLPPLENTTSEELLRTALSFSSNDQTAAILAQSGLTRANIFDNTFKWPMSGRQSSTNQVVGTFVDAKDDFARVTLEVNDYDHQARIHKVNKQEVNLSAVDNYNQAYRLLNAALSKYREGDYFNALRTNAAAMLLEEGDLITASSDNGGFVNLCTRVEELTIGSAPECLVDVVGRKYSTLMFSDEAAQHVISLPTTLRFIKPHTTLLEFVDLPAVREEHAETAGFYVIGSYDASVFGDWRGFSLWADYGEGYKRVIEGDIVGAIGTATTILASHSAAVWDRTNSFTVEMDNGALASLTEAQILQDAQANLAVLGNEYLQFATVVDNGGGSYTLSNFLRGRFGTERNTTHGASERFAMMEGAAFVPIEPSRLNLPFNYKAVTVNQDVADAAPQSFTWTGGTLRTLSPVHPSVVRDSAGSLLAGWTRRSRKGFGVRSGVAGVPVAEEEEKYEMEIYSDATRTVVKRVLPVTVGMPLAGFLLSNKFGFVGVTANTFIAPSNSLTAARTAQEVPGPGNYVEGAILYNLLTERVLFGLQYRGRDWRTAGVDLNAADLGLLTPTLTGTMAMPYMVIMQAISFGGSFGNRLHVYEYGTRIFSASSLPGQSDYDEDFGWLSSPSGNSVFRIRFNFVGSSVRIQKAHTSNVPLTTIATGKVPALFPLFAVAASPGDGFVGVGSIFMTTAPEPKTIYSLSQQEEDFGSAQNPVYANIYQISKVVGRGAPLEATL